MNRAIQSIVKYQVYFLFRKFSGLKCPVKLRPLQITMASSSSTSSSSDASDSEGISTSSGQKPRLKKQEDVDSSNTDSESDKDSSEDETSSESNNEDASNTDAPVLSHAAQRRQKKKELKAASNPSPSEEPPKKKQKVKNTAELAPSKIPKRQNSVWVGNLAFKTTPEALRQFFDGVGEITRIHMPMKMVSGPPGAGARKENRGSVYIMPKFGSCLLPVSSLCMNEPGLHTSTLRHLTRKPWRSRSLRIR